MDEKWEEFLDLCADIDLVNHELQNTPSSRLTAIEQASLVLDKLNELIRLASEARGIALEVKGVTAI